MSELYLKGKILGFEDYNNYVLEDSFGENSPFRLLSCPEKAVTFVAVNPYYIVDDYSFEIEDSIVRELMLEGNYIDDIAILCIVRPNENACIVRPNENTLYVNLRSPLIINIKNGYFVQTILQNEMYGVSVPFYAKKANN
ncbi:MAG: flagellar assembly protein FliW [Proteobacteria bacterium]|nr:flagellar assembly protein FliW [Pseudomonadota bacterium]